jgi:hypothetical protein
MIWIGLVISLVSALVASFAELKHPKHVKPWSRAFVYHNRFKLAAAGFAVLGFLAATLTVLEDHSKSEEAQRHLRDENNQLKSLMLAGRSVAPTVKIIFIAPAPMSSKNDSNEERLWIDSGRPMRLPHALGYVPSSTRRELFSGASPEPLLKMLGDVDFRVSPVFRFMFAVHEDGTATTFTTTMDQHSLRTEVLNVGDEPRAIKFTLKVNTTLDSIKLFDSLVRDFDQKEALLAVRVFTRTCSPQYMKDTKGHSRIARVFVSLDEADDVSATALLRESNKVCQSDGTTSYEWQFRDPPELVVSTH